MNYLEINIYVNVNVYVYTRIETAYICEMKYK